MNELQWLAAFIAFVACFLAVGFLWNTDASRRRKVRSSRSGLTDQLLGLQGPSLKQWLAAAGFFSSNASIVYSMAVILAAFVGGLVGIVAASWIEVGTFGILAIALGIAFLFSRVPGAWINARWRRRSREIGHAMPLMLDMMDVCTTAGLSVDDAWESVERQMEGVSPSLAEEMELVAFEVQLGRTREKALNSMAERTGVGDFAALASMLGQSERFGTGLSETFQAQGAAIRQDYVRALEEDATQVERENGSAGRPADAAGVDPGYNAPDDRRDPARTLYGVLTCTTGTNLHRG